MRLRGKASRAGKWKLLQKHEAILFSKKKSMRLFLWKVEQSLQRLGFPPSTYDQVESEP